MRAVRICLPRGASRRTRSALHMHNDNGFQASGVDCHTVCRRPLQRQIINNAQCRAAPQPCAIYTLRQDWIGIPPNSWTLGGGPAGVLGDPLMVVATCDQVSAGRHCSWPNVTWGGCCCADPAPASCARLLRWRAIAARGQTLLP